MTEYIDIALSDLAFFLFWRPFWILFKNMIGHIGRSNHPIWLTLLANHESAGLKTFKITAMTSLILKKKIRLRKYLSNYMYKVSLKLMYPFGLCVSTHI